MRETVIRAANKGGAEAVAKYYGCSLPAAQHLIEKYVPGFECVYCGEVKPSENATGSDVACCGEVGHASATGAQS